MRIRRIITVMLVLLSVSKLTAQQDAQYTQYMYNQAVLNPAYAGSKGHLAMGALGRTQWVGIKGAPQTLTLFMHGPIGEKLGVGGTLISDKIGPITETNFYGDFSYTLDVSAEGRLALGIKAGLTLHNIDSNLSTVSPDPALIAALSQGNQLLPNFGAGAFYYTDRFYLGLSMPNFLQTRYYERTGTLITNASEKMHLFGTTGYVFDLTDNIKLKPSLMLKGAIGAPLSIDLSANALFSDRFELGLSYRLDDSISAILGLNVNSEFRIGYAYDYTLSKLGDFNSGSHEIMLTYEFLRKELKSPRFF